MKIVFMGSPDFAVPSLEKIHAAGFEVVSVVSNVDKRRGRGNETAPTPVKEKAVELGIPVIEVEDLKSEKFSDDLKKLTPDLFVVVAFRVLPKSILEIPKIGSVNLHASLLPNYRGAAPIHHAVINGEKETGCTIFFLDEKVDTGKILLQKRMPIFDSNTTGDIYTKLMSLGSDTLLEAIQMISSGEYELLPQNNEEATPAPKLFKHNTEIDFNQPAEKVRNFIRGLNPFPTAWTTWSDELFKIHSVEIGPNLKLEPGKILVKDQKIYVGCNIGTLELTQIQLPGKTKMNGKDFLHGYEVKGFFKKNSQKE